MKYINENYPNNISYSFSISFQTDLSLNPQNKDLLDMVLFEDDFIKQFNQYIKRQINKNRPSSVRKSKEPIFLELISIIEISRAHFADLYSENNIEEQRSFHPHIHGIICFTSTFRKMKSSLESFEVMIKNVVSMINEKINSRNINMPLLNLQN